MQAGQFGEGGTMPMRSEEERMEQAEKGKVGLQIQGLKFEFRNYQI